MTLSTTERGYGRAHQARREELLPAAIGKPCGFCGYEMRIGQALDLDHSDPEARKRGEPGDRIVHAECNRAQRAFRGEFGLSRSTRFCEICGALFASRTRETRTCSRACGVELKRRNSPPKIRAKKKYKYKSPSERICTECGAVFDTRHTCKVTCSADCARQRTVRMQAEAYASRSGTYAKRIRSAEMVDRDRG